MDNAFCVISIALMAVLAILITVGVVTFLQALGCFWGLS